MTPPARRVPVAVGIIEDRDGNLLMQRRQPGRACAGDWEFPGGKIEEGEDPRAAVARELLEEVAVTVRRAAPWVRRTHSYPHGTFDLHLVQVLEWEGEPRAAEAQEIGWFARNGPPPARLLAANHSFWRHLGLPRIAAISSAGTSGADRFLERWDTLQQEGVRLLQVRDKEFPPGERTALLKAAVARRRSPGAIVMLNGDPEDAQRHGAQGAHLDAARLMAAARRPDCEWVSASCHNRQEVARAGELGVDFAYLGPVRQTASHPRATPLGWERFAGLAADSAIPLYAIGGMTPGDLDEARCHGAHGIAALGAFAVR